MTRNVLITGLGVVSPLGNTVPLFWESLINGRSAISQLSGFDIDLKVTVGAQIKNFDANSQFSESDLQFLDRFSQFAVVAAREAVKDAGISVAEAEMKNAACIIGTGCGGKQTDEETYYKLYKNGGRRTHPLTIPKGMPSAAASMVSHHLGIKGPVFSVVSACASGLHALIQGAMQIQAGLVDIVLVGGTDAPFTYGLLKAWEALRVMSNDTCRPFSKDRSGMVLGEGAAMLVLESERSAAARKASVYARISGYGMSSDAGHITRPDVDGIASAILAAINYAGVSPQSVNYINAHGTGTEANDIAETTAIHSVFGEYASEIAISSTKSMHGHALGASSAMEMVATVLAVKHGIVPPTANFTEAGDGCDLDYVPNKARKMVIKRAITNSFAFGGLNAVAIIESI